jgi:hypothetical protein
MYTTARGACVRVLIGPIEGGAASEGCAIFILNIEPRSGATSMCTRAWRRADAHTSRIR